jgi:hypothetical protein
MLNGSIAPTERAPGFFGSAPPPGSVSVPNSNVPDNSPLLPFGESLGAVPTTGISEAVQQATNPTVNYAFVSCRHLMKFPETSVQQGQLVFVNRNYQPPGFQADMTQAQQMVCLMNIVGVNTYFKGQSRVLGTGAATPSAGDDPVALAPATGGIT